MRNAIALTAMACLLIGASAPARTEDLEGTLRKVKETGTFTIGHRESSLPLSYLDEGLQPIGFSIELCKHVVDAVKAKLGTPGLAIKYNPVTSANRIPLVANGTVDIECGGTANNLTRQKQVAFSVATFVSQPRWLAKTSSSLASVAALKGKTEMDALIAYLQGLGTSLKNKGS